MRHLALTALALASASAAHAQIFNGKLNDFQDGSLQSWTGGASMLNIANGGPLGTNDRYLQVTATGGTSAGSRLATFNNSWNGNYLSAGITGIRVSFKNLNNVNLEMRLVLFDDVDGSRWTSTSAFIIAPNTNWATHTFSVEQGSLVRVMGARTYSDMITNVRQIMFRHDAGSASPGGSVFSGAVGIDNVQAVPEPATFLAIGLGIAAVLRRRRGQ